MALDGKALTAVGIGALFAWSGIKGWSVSGTLADIVTGVQPSQANSQPLTYVDTLSNATTVLGGVGGIVDVAMQYQGHAYLFGGAPGTDGAKPWDCSSFVNFVASVKVGLPIPGYGPGKYNGTVHGPPTGSWAVWTGLNRINRSDVQAGDIIVWAGHMGIAISNTQLISALNPKEGTRVTTLDGTGRGPIIKCGRYPARPATNFN